MHDAHICSQKQALQTPAFRHQHQDWPVELRFNVQDWGRARRASLDGLALRNAFQSVRWEEDGDISGALLLSSCPDA